MGLKGEETLYHSTVAETEARASEEALQAQDREDKGLICFLGWATRDSKSFTVNVRAEITNEALAVEASRYNFFPFVFGGIMISSLLLLLMGMIGLWCWGNFLAWEGWTPSKESIFRLR